MKNVLPLLLVLLAMQAMAEVNTDKKNSKSGTKVERNSRRGPFLSASSQITLANGTMKSLEELEIGEELTTCRNGKKVVTSVQKITVFENPSAKLVSVYLHPDQQEMKMVPALLLEATRYHKVETNHGRKKIKKLTKDDTLYHFDPETGLVTSWKVGLIKHHTRSTPKAFNITTADGSFWVDNLIVFND
ncbi:hypothetical protein CLV98_11362 [Dyadobacter jejuensis]|uniref:Intein n=1 Tax=Dyadobacter jejuensis TaxID=1082580 RepID=A0A316ACS1_9BACT|nr:hypothetical protein [Dyadobacter jejuensis]PWJ55586.1 hypothetical protein CLV98_11362 [Dyadobacter jejuensis]